MSEHIKTILEIKNLSKAYQSKKKLLGVKELPLLAVNDLSLDILTGETLGVVGESGCGKSTLGKIIVKLLEPTSGKIIFQGVDLTTKNDRDMLPFRKDLQIIFQDPYSSLNPWMTVHQLIAEPLVIHHIVPAEEVDQRVQYLLEKVGLGQYDSQRFPFQFSGGQRQRICIARALAVQPKFIVCDEPVSALDVSIQSQIINLLIDLQKEFGLTYLFISHSFSVIRNIADRVAVMYLGRLVELGPVENFFQNPAHPYAQMLIEAIPIPDPDQVRKPVQHIGEIDDGVSNGQGCGFYPRCQYRQGICRQQVPPLREIARGHWVACHQDQPIKIAVGGV